MSASVKAAIAAVLVYLRDNPGAVAVIVGEAALVFAHFGLHLSTATLASAAAVALPILLAYFHVAKKAGLKAAVPVMVKPQPVAVVPVALHAEFAPGAIEPEPETAEAVETP